MEGVAVELAACLGACNDKRGRGRKRAPDSLSKIRKNAGKTTLSSVDWMLDVPPVEIRPVIKRQGHAAPEGVQRSGEESLDDLME